MIQMAELPIDTINHFEGDGKGNINLTITELVRCKDCEYRTDPQKCPMCYEEWYEIDEGDGYMDSDYILYDNTEDGGYCHKGKLRGDTE